MKGCINKVGNSWGFTLTIGFDENGKRLQKRYGKFKTKKEAEKACNEIIYQIEHGTFIIPNELTVEKYLNEWLETYCKQKLTPCTYSGYKVNVENHIIPALGKIPLQKLQAVQVQRLYNSKLKSCNNPNGELSPASIRYIHAVLRKALNQAIKMQYIQHNICDAVELPKIKNTEAQFLDKQQVIETLNALKDTEIYTPILLAISLGLRRGELLGLQWKDFDFKNNMVSISRSYLPVKENGQIFSECKTQKSHRTLAVPENVMDYLKQERVKQYENKLFYGSDYKNYDLVYCNSDGTPVSPTAFNHRFTKTLKEKDLPHIRVHDLRHTNASLMLSQGVPMKVASERLGHTTIAITMDLYSHIDAELQYDAAQRINLALLG